jgi:hypothetical protein
VVEGKRKNLGSAAGANPPPPAPHHRRRLLSAPANDNATTPAGRVLRAAVFVAIGAVLAWAMHYLTG